MEADERKKFLSKLKMTVGIVVATILVVLLLIYAVKVFLLVFAGALVAIFFRAVAGWLSGFTHLPMKASLPISVIGVLAIWAGLILLLQPKVSQQVETLKKQVPQAAKELEGKLQKYQTGRFVLRQLPFDISATGSDNASQGNTTSSDAAQRRQADNSGNKKQDSGADSNSIRKMLKSFFSTTLGVLGDFYVILLLGAFFIANPSPYKKGIIRLVPQRKRQRAGEVIDATGITLKRWLFGKLISMLVVAILTVIGLWIMGVPLFITLAILAGLLSFIPNFGPLMAIVPAFLVAYVQEPSLGFWVIGLYVVIQAIESNLITPIIMRRQIQIPLAMTLFSQVLLALLIGGLGLIFATPIIATFMVIIQMLYIEDTLGDRDLEVRGEKLARQQE